MDKLIDWMTSQSGTSLLVALIALAGVFFATIWNNWAADKRRRADQVSEDKRRQEERAIEEDRHSSQLQMKEWSRQRHAVAKCISELYKAAHRVNESTKSAFESSTLTNETFSPVDSLKITKITALIRFYSEAEAQLSLCDLEITQPLVRESITELWQHIAKRHTELMATLKAADDGQWKDVAVSETPMDDKTAEAILKLSTIARYALLEEPEHMAQFTTFPNQDQ